MDETPNLGLPYIMAAQSQKHVTHNEAIRALDAVVQLSVLDRDLSAPPASPAEGARYIVAASPTGAWSGHAGKIAAYQDGAWMFYAPLEGWIAWVADEDAAVVWSGSAWGGLTTGAGGAGTFATVGIGATADATNRLAVKSDAVLFSHDDVTPGNGSIQHKLNKQSAAKTATFLFQSNWSGRAEMGLAGDDDFHFKVSADGTTWKEAIVIDRASGSVRFPLTGGREKLAADRTYYVRTDGSNANNGLANTAAGAWATLQYAYDYIAGNIDFGGKSVTIKVADGTYTAGLIVAGPWTGGGTLVVEGNVAAKANCSIEVATGSSPFYILATLPGQLGIKGFRLKSTYATSVALVNHSGRGTIVLSNLELAGASTTGYSGMIHAGEDGGRIIVASDIAITGSAAAFIVAVSGGRIQFYGQTIPLTGTLNFSWAFALSTGLSEITAGGATFNVAGATVTGTRYSVSNNAIINTGGGGANYFPGSIAGGASAGGIYA